MISIKCLIAIFLFLIPSISSRYVPPQKADLQYFVNGKVRPSHYNVHLNTHVETCDKGCSFEGKINITVAVDRNLVGKNEKVTAIELNQDSEIHITSCKLTDKKGSNIPVKFALNNATEILTVRLENSQELQHDQDYFLYFEYSCVHNDDMLGFYRSSYQTEKGATRWLLTTQFQPNDARNAYPCFDEPMYKATYDMEISMSKAVADDGYHALFNTAVVKKSQSGNIVTYKFARTPYPLSSYLVAFVVTDFKGTKPETFFNDYGSEKNTEKIFQTWGEKKYIEGGDAELAQTVGTAAVKLLSEYMGINFAYPKIDQIGIPDFAAGAMENWGLITYRERLIFYNKATASILTKRDIVSVIAHELTHQWYGNLVTLLSWDYIWLNEGFATYFSYLISHKVAEVAFNNKNWDTMGIMVIDETQLRAMETDALEHSRPLSVQVKNPSIVGSYFDSISYAKGASILRMWSHALSEEVFRKGLNIYLNDRKEKNSIPMNLLKSFEKACNDTKCIDPKFGTVSELFEEWHSTYGYPVIYVEKTGKTSYKLRQEQFLWFQHNNNTKHDNKYNVPITYSVQSKPQFEDTKPQFWLKKSDASGQINLPKEEKWIILNNQHTGYYRILYEKDNWYALINQLRENHLAIHEANRAELINDAFGFARSTYKDYKVGYDLAFDLVKYMNKEENLIPWKTAFNSFSFLNNKLRTSSKYTNFKQYMLHLVQPRYDALGLTVKDDDAFMENILRMSIGDWACTLGYKPCIEDALRLYKNPSEMSADVKKIVYCTAIREGDDRTWDEMWKMYLKSTDNIEQTLLLSSLACSKSPKKLNEFLTKTITPNSGIRKQDYAAAFSAVYRAGNVDAALEFLHDKFESIAQFYHGIDPLGELLIGISAKLNSEKDLAEMEELQDKIENSDIEMVKVAEVSMGKAIEIIESNIKWINLKRQTIEDWLENNKVPLVPMAF